VVSAAPTLREVADAVDAAGLTEETMDRWVRVAFWMNIAAACAWCVAGVAKVLR